MANEHTNALSATVNVVLVGDPSALEPATTAVTDRVGGAVSLRCETAAEARERLAAERVHCVVCLPEHVDESLLAAVDRYDERLPAFVVGPSSAAAGALEAGADDVIDPGERPAVVGSRIENAARRFRLERDDRAASPLARGLLAGADAVVAALDADGTVSTVTAAVESVLGYTASEVEGRPLSRLVHPSDRTGVEDARRRVEGDGLGARTRERVRLQHADGDRYVHAVTLINRLDDPAVEAVVVTIERAADPPPEDPVSSAIDRVAFPLLVLDERWAVRSANGAAAELLGRPPADARGGVVWDLLPESIVSAFSERLREAARTGTRVEFVVTPPTTDRPLEIVAAPTENGMVVYATPPGPEREADAGPHEAVLESLEDGICVLEGETIAYANAALFAHLSVDSLEGRAFATVFDEDLAEAVRERSNGQVRWMEPIEYVHDDPDARRFDVFVTPLSPDRRVCLFRPAKRSPTAQLATLREAVAGVDDETTSQGRLRRAVVDALVDAFALDGAYWLVPEDGTFRPMEASGAWEGAAEPRGVPIEGDDPRIEAALEAATPTTVETSWLDGPDGRPVVPGVAVLVPIGDHGVVVGRPDERETVLRSGGPLAAMEVFAAYARTAFDALESRLERFEADRERSRTERSVESLMEAETVLERAFEPLITATTRADVDRALCRSIAALEGVELVWVGDVDLTIDAVTVREAGGRREYLESVATPVAADAEPSGRAVHERAPVTVADVAAERTAENWAAIAFERGFRSALSVPLSFESVTYGTLSAYATEPDAFDRHRRRAMSRIADLGAFVLAALDVRRALETGTVTELELLADPDADPLARFVATIDARLDVEAVVPGEQGTTVFCTAASLPPVGFDGLVDEIAGVSRIRRRSEVGDASGRTALSITCTAETIAGRLAGHGGTVRQLSPHGAQVRVALELLPDAVRPTLAALEEAFGPFDLRVRHTRERAERPGVDTLTAVRERLTERQLQTLSAAYHGGYFEWPRERTGEEIARTLGVSQPTFNRHFRAAERNLLSVLFENEDR